MRGIVTILVVLLAAGAVHAQRMSYGKAVASPRSQPIDTEAIGIDQHQGEQVPLDLVFKDEHDHDITLGSCVGGKPTVLVLAYYRCPNVCNAVISSVTDELKKLPRDVGDLFNVVVVSFDPKDKWAIAAGKKKAYLDEYGRAGAEKGWHFLTGEEPQIKELCEAVGFRYQYDKEKKQYNHDSGITILTSHGKIASYLRGVDYKDLAQHLEDAGAGKIEPKKEPGSIMKFLCYEQNPETGEYSLSVMKGLRIVFGLMVIGLGFWLVRVWRRPIAKIDAPTVEHTDVRG